MNNSSLYLIGNGFDLYHGIKSSFFEFKQLVYKKNYELHELVEDYLSVEKYWSDLEQALGYLDVDSVIDYASDFLYSYATEDWSDQYHHSYQFEIERIVRDLSIELKGLFCDWIEMLEIPDKESINCKLINIDSGSTFMTFNYTDTLEKIYSVPSSNILHIHGKSGNSKSDIVLGHSWSPNEITTPEEDDDFEDIDTRVMIGNEIIDKYFLRTFKPTAQIITSNQAFFQSIKDVTNVFIMGHSLSEVDYNYFEVISNSVNSKANWKVSYYNDDELVTHNETINKLGIDKTKVSFLKMEEF